jgi:hypothetical protein
MATQTTQTQTILPEWYTQYVKDLLGRASAATSRGYQAYDRPRVAGFSPEQEEAFGGYKETMGAYQPYIDKSAQLINRGTGSFTDPGVASRYMNPYIQNVISGIGSTAGRNLSENILPQINRTFVGGGTFGGSRSGDFMQRAVRDTQSQALTKQLEAMSGAYESAANLYGDESGRAMTGAGQFAKLGEQQQEQRARELAGLEAIGQKRQDLGQRSADLAYGDFERQRDYELNQVKEFAGIGGTPSAAGTGTSIKTEPGTSGFGSALGTAATIAGAIGSSGGFGKGGWLSGIFGKKEGGEIEGPVKNGKRNIKHPMHGLGWLKDVR